MLLVVLQAVKTKIHFGVLLLSALLHFLKINHDMLWYKWLFIVLFHILQPILDSNKLCASPFMFSSILIFAHYISGCWLSTGYCSLQCFRRWHVWLCLSNSHCSFWHCSCTWGKWLHVWNVLLQHHSNYILDLVLVTVTLPRFWCKSTHKLGLILNTCMINFPCYCISLCSMHLQWISCQCWYDTCCCL